MNSQPIERPIPERTSDVAPTLHAFVVGPAVGSMVLLLALVGLAAVAVGAFTGLAYRNGVTRHGRRPPS
jgi:hypothetical protein